MKFFFLWGCIVLFVCVDVCFDDSIRSVYVYVYGSGILVFFFFMVFFVGDNDMCLLFRGV